MWCITRPNGLVAQPASGGLGLAAGQNLAHRPAIRPELLPFAFKPLLAQAVGAEIPVGTDPPSHLSQIAAEVFVRRPAPIQ